MNTLARLILVLAALATVAAAVRASRPVFPPTAEDYELDFSYDPLFYDPSAEVLMTGAFHSSAKRQMFSVISKDSLRTKETILFRGDKKQTYALLKFGEFGWQCHTTKGDANGLTGMPSFVPPMGFDQTFFDKNAVFVGRQVVDSRSVDVYTIADIKTSIGTTKNATLYFDSNTLAPYKITEYNNKAMRSAVFADIRITNQDASYFALPSGASC